MCAKPDEGVLHAPQCVECFRVPLDVLDNGALELVQLLLEALTCWDGRCFGPNGRQRRRSRSDRGRALAEVTFCRDDSAPGRIERPRCFRLASRRLVEEPLRLLGAARHVLESYPSRLAGLALLTDGVDAVLDALLDAEVAPAELSKGAELRLELLAVLAVARRRDVVADVHRVAIVQA